MANAVIVTPVRWWTPGWRWRMTCVLPDDRPVGVLRVRAPHAFGQQQLPAPLVAFLQRHPQLSVEWMLNDNTVDFLSDNIDCAIRVGAEVDPATVSVLLAEVPRCVVASPELLAKYPPLTSLEALSGLPWIAINTFYQHEVRLRHQASGQIVLYSDYSLSEH